MSIENSGFQRLVYKRDSQYSFQCRPYRRECLYSEQFLCKPCAERYDFKTGQPRCETAESSDRYIPEAFTRQLEADRASRSQSQGAAITLSYPSMGSAPVEEQGFAHGGGVSDDFRRFLEQHPDLSFDEALRRFKDEQKAKQRNKGIKLG